MRASRQEPSRATLFLRLPATVNLRIDAAVLHQRCKTGKRVSRAALLLEILDAALPQLPKAMQAEVEG